MGRDESQQELPILDKNGYDVVDTLTYQFDERAGQTLSKPLKFIGYDGKTYWAKSTSQHGLVTELIGGRLAAATGAGPAARIIHINEASLPSKSELPPGREPDDYLGLVVGVENVPGTENLRDIAAYVRPADLPRLIEPASRALVIAFQSWLGVGDEQMLVRLDDGHCFSIDYGECFSNVQKQASPTVVLVSNHGLPDEIGRDWSHLEPAVGRIEGLADDQIHNAVNGVPHGERWKAEHDWRLAIREWLIIRRTTLRGVLEQWANDR